MKNIMILTFALMLMVGLCGLVHAGVVLVSESETSGIWTGYYNYTSTNNTTSDTFQITPTTSNLTYNLSMVSNNSLASYSLHNDNITVLTGILIAGNVTTYNFTANTLENYNFTTNFTTNTSSKKVFIYNSSNSEVEQDLYFSGMSAGTYDLKNSTDTIATATVVDGWLKFEDASPMKDDEYTVEKDNFGVTAFAAVVFTGLTFVAVARQFIRSRFFGGRRSRR